MVLQPLGVAQVRAGVAAYLPGLHRHPVRRGRRTRGDGGLGVFGIGEQPELEGLQLSPATGQLDDGPALLLGTHREERHLRDPVEQTGELAGAVGHRVLLVTLVPTAAHE